MHHKPKNKRLITIAILLLLISVGFAYLTANLNLDGLAGVKGNTWKIYFDNVEIYKGSNLATTNPTTTGTNTTDLEYSVTLNKPGDVYKFYVDIVNEGSLDAMINVVKMTDLTNEQKKYINYTVTYEDETPIEKLNLLAKKSGDTPTKDTIVVTIEFKKDIAEEDLPTTGDVTLKEKLHLDYRQANTSAIARATTKPTITYDWNYNFINNGNFEDGLEAWTSYRTAQLTIDYNNTFNGKPSVNIYTSTENYSGISQNLNVNLNNYINDYTFNLSGCFYKDDNSSGGGVNEPIRYYIHYKDTEGTLRNLGMSTNGPGKKDYNYIKDNFINQNWVCLYNEFTLPKSIDFQEDNFLHVDGHNLSVNDNFWIANLELIIKNKVQYTYKSTISSFPIPPTRDGYTFDGWYTDPYGGTQVTTSLVVRESQTLYAHWSQN